VSWFTIAIISGARDPGGAQTVSTGHEPSAPAMPAFAWQLNDAQVAAIATDVRDRLGKARRSARATRARRAQPRLRGAVEVRLRTVGELSLGDTVKRDEFGFAARARPSKGDGHCRASFEARVPSPGLRATPDLNPAKPADSG